MSIIVILCMQVCISYIIYIIFCKFISLILYIDIIIFISDSLGKIKDMLMYQAPIFGPMAFWNADCPPFSHTLQ